MGTYKEAEAIARMMLRGKTDKAGRPMFDHAMRVADKMGTYGEAALALLHDVVEDSQATLDDLEALGFDGHQRRTLDALTRREGEEYGTYLRRLAHNEDAVKIKLADIEDHLTDRPGFVLPASLADRYQRARVFLLGIAKGILK